MLYNFRIYLPSWLFALLLSCVSHAAYSYGMVCEKPNIVGAVNTTTPFRFKCKNSTGVTFSSYKIFPRCLESSKPENICKTLTFTATGCSHAIRPGAVCEVQGNFAPMKTGNYVLNFDDKYGGEMHYDIFCKGCIKVDTSNFAYLTPAPTSDLIDQCTVNVNNGGFVSCTEAYNSANIQNYSKLTFAIVSEVEYAYVTSQNDGVVYQCTINANGSFDVCSQTTPNLDPSGWVPYDIAFARVNNVQYAYVSDVNQGYIYKCSLDSTGNFTECKAILSQSFYAPYAIDFATVNNVQHVYIGDAGSGSGFGSVYICDLNSDGSFGTCTSTPQAPSAIPSWIPYGIDFTTVNGVQYAYVADNGTSLTTGNVWQCKLKNDGSFDTCAVEQNVPSPTWVPSDIAFATFNETQYAYIPNYQGPIYGNMFWCTLDKDGTFKTCNSTPTQTPVPWRPASIAFRLK